MEMSALKPDEKTVVSVIVAVVVLFVLMYIYHHYINTQPVGAITATQYGQLPPAAQANYVMNSAGYWQPRGLPVT